MSKRKHPSPEMIGDLDRLFEKHNWSGAAIGLRTVSKDDDDNGCPPGTVPKEVMYKLPNGTWATKTICVKERE